MNARFPPDITVPRSSDHAYRADLFVIVKP